LFADCQCGGIQAGAAATGQNDAFTFHLLASCIRN
jgi:hypothetical protein